VIIRVADPNERLVKFLGFSQNDDAPAVGTGSVLDALEHRKLTYYLSACVMGVVLLGMWVTCIGCTHVCCGPRRRRDRGSGSNTFEMDTWMCYWYCDPVTDCADLCCYGCSGDGVCTDVCSTCRESTSQSCNCNSLTANTCDCCKGDGGDDFLGMALMCFVCLVVVGLAMAFVGFLAAIITVVTFVQRSWQKYLQVVELKHLTKEFVVEDLAKSLTGMAEDASIPAGSASVPAAAVVGSQASAKQDSDFAANFQSPEQPPGQQDMDDPESGQNAQVTRTNSTAGLRPLTEADRNMQARALLAVQMLHGIQPWSARFPLHRSERRPQYN